MGLNMNPSTSWNPTALSFGSGSPMDLNSFGFQTGGAMSMATAPMGAAPTAVASPLTAPMPVPVPVPNMPPVGGPQVAAPNDGSQQSFGNSLLWNGEGQDRSLNYEGLGLIGKGIATLGSLYNSWQQNKLARDSLSFQKESYATNLANQTKSYNSSLEDRIRGRYTMDQQYDPNIQKTIDERSL